MSTTAPSAPELPSHTSSASRADEFHAVAGSETEVTSASAMLFCAYALFWVLVFAFVVRTWQTQRRTEQRLLALEQQLHSPPTSE